MSNTQSKVKAWTILALTSLAVGATYYVYDSISPLQELFKKELGFNSTQYGFLFSSYSFLNTFLLLALFGGIILDLIGIKKTGFLFVTFCSIGALLTAFGGSEMFKNSGSLYNSFKSFMPNYSPELKMMVLGRILFGLGAETLIVVQNKVTSKWFKDKELAFAFALNLAICRLGTAAALICSPIIAVSSGLNSSLWLAAIIMLTGFLAFIFYMYFDDYKVEIKSDDTEIFRLKDLAILLKTKEYIYITLLCITFYSAVFPFQSFAPDILKNKFSLSIETSGLLTSIIIWGTIVCTPLFGWLFDKYRKGGQMMIFGSALLFISHLLLALTPFNPYILMFMIGIAFSLVPAAMWPSVTYIVEEKKLGTAFGLMTSLQNLGLWAFPILAGYVTDNVNKNVSTEMLTKGTAHLNYTYTMLIFVALAVIGFVFSLLLLQAQKLKKV